MGDPKIRYDILANAEGEEDVAALARELDKLDDAVDPQAAARARALAGEIRALADKRQAVQQFVDQLKRVREAESALEQAQQAAQRYGRELAGVATPTRAAVGQMERLKDAVRAAKLQQQQATGALDQTRGAMSRLGLSATDLSGSQARLNAALQGTKAQVQQLASGYQQTAAAAAASSVRQVTAARTIGKGVTSISTQLNQLQRVAQVALGGGVFAGLARDAAQTADAYKNLGARIRLVTGEGQAFEQAFEGVFDVAKRTNSSVEETGQLFVKLAQAGKELGLSQQQAIGLTETINQAIQLSGGSADSARAAIVQLVQGLQSGVLRGEEFNSIMEQSPRLSKALAEGLGVTTGELRKMAQQGALTTETVIKALQGQSAAVQREFEQLPPTVGRALQNLSTEWTRYVGEVDEGWGVSERAVKAINALASNLEELGSALFSAGKAVAAYKALQAAQTFLGIGIEARAAAASVTALSAAQASAATTGAAAAASAGRFAAALGGLKLFSVVGILANFREIGTAIGEGVAKLFGWGRALEANEAKIRADERATREAAAAKAELAAMAERARERALGLTQQSKALLTEFQAMSDKGRSTAETLDKVAKSLNLSDVQGIQSAVAALDVLRLRGEITAEQLRSTLQAALKDVDLTEFEAHAKRAFDGSVQGVQRLSQALGALQEESLRRVGSSLAEMTEGLGDGVRRALRDLDALARTLDQVAGDAQRSGELLKKGLDQALAAASTERAVQAVIDRLEDLGKQGKLSGEQLADGLDRAKRQLDDMKPGINSLAEAYKTFGITSREELKRTAETNRQAWELIRRDATLSLEQKQAAFKKYAESAIAANGGVADSTIKNQAQALQLAVQVDATGKTFVRAFGEADGAVRQTTQLVNALGEQVNAAGERINQMAAGLNTLASTIERNKSVSRVLTGGGEVSRTLDTGGFSAPNLPGQWVFDHAGWQAAGGPLPQGPNDHRFFRRVPGTGPNDRAGTPFGGPAGAPASAYVPGRTTGAGGPAPVTVNVTIGGTTRTISAPTQADADALIKALEDAYKAGGGP